jgi:16S rRNA (cytidine1402-2'-O)-methyltransferase
MSSPLVYLIPSQLDEAGFHVIPPYVTDAVKNCQVFFVENERSARRFLKKIWREMIIDNYEWYVSDGTKPAETNFITKIKEGKTIGIISEAGCPGIADPGQELIRIAHEMNTPVKPLVGPSSILLALMASGMNGQQFSFVGYLPIKDLERNKTIKDLEAESAKKNATQIFIETPYRNNQMMEALCRNCKPSTRLCVAADLTGEHEWIKTKTIESWKKDKVDIHKRPVIFLLYAGN